MSGAESPDLRPLSPEEERQLSTFAVVKGRAWRVALCHYWYRGEPVPGYPLLYGLRNSHGFLWLNLWRVPIGFVPSAEDALRAVASLLKQYRGQRLPVVECDAIMAVLRPMLKETTDAGVHS